MMRSLPVIMPATCLPRTTPTALLWLVVGVCALAGMGCGYRLGVPKPPAMAQIDRIFIAIPQNHTQYPALEAKLANHLTDALIQEATYQPSASATAHAILNTEISSVDYQRTRASITDGIRPEELEMTVTVQWTVIDSQSGRVLMKGKTCNDTRFFLSNVRLSTARDNAFPDALGRVSRSLVAELSNFY